MTKTIVAESKERTGEESISRMQSLACQGRTDCSPALYLGMCTAFHQCLGRLGGGRSRRGGGSRPMRRTGKVKANSRLVQLRGLKGGAVKVDADSIHAKNRACW